ncbi:MAG: EamA family transporter [Duganella sp.]
MERWLLYAVLSMVFAGVTAVIAKPGLNGISADLGMVVRTCFVFVFVLLFAVAVVPAREVQSLTWTHIAWLAGSAVATALSWIFYYKAIKAGQVSTVALIDKGSVVIALLLGWMFLEEALTPAKLAGCGLIVAGLLVIARA